MWLQPQLQLQLQLRSHTHTHTATAAAGATAASTAASTATATDTVAATVAATSTATATATATGTGTATATDTATATATATDETPAAATAIATATAAQLEIFTQMLPGSSADTSQPLNKLGLGPLKRLGFVGEVSARSAGLGFSQLRLAMSKFIHIEKAVVLMEFVWVSKKGSSGRIGVLQGNGSWEICDRLGRG